MIPIDLSANGVMLPLVVAAALALFAWYFRSKGAPAETVDPFDAFAQSMLALAKARADASAKDQFKARAVEAMETVLPAATSSTLPTRNPPK